MAFPPVHHCLVCEDVRNEVGGKSSLMGFFGLAPEVEIGLRQWNRGTQLAFMLLFGDGTGNFKVGVQIVDPEGQELGKVGDLEFSFEKSEAKQKIAAVFGFRSLKFPKAGRYVFKLLVDGNPHFETTFDVQQRDTSA